LENVFKKEERYDKIRFNISGLFHRAISESGSALNPWAYQTPDASVELAFELGKEFGAKTSDPSEVLEVLKTVNPEKLVLFLFTGLLQVSPVSTAHFTYNQMCG
jgi:carboxylesterase type B